MQAKETVFEKTYQNYLQQLKIISFESIADNLGVKTEGNRIKIPLFLTEYAVSSEGIADPAGKKPTHDICVILCKYILRCPGIPPKERAWVSFKDFKDSGPLINYFTNSVERAMQRRAARRRQGTRRTRHGRLFFRETKGFKKSKRCLRGLCDRA